MKDDKKIKILMMIILNKNINKYKKLLKNNKI